MNMSAKKSVLIIGLEPTLVDYAAFPGMDAAKVLAGLEAVTGRLQGLGYDVQLCLIDLGATAEDVVKAQLARGSFDCIVIGAGVRTGPSHFILFERLINMVHRHAPQASLCFNTNPGDTVEAVQRWI